MMGWFSILARFVGKLGPVVSKLQASPKQALGQAKRMDRGMSFLVKRTRPDLAEADQGSRNRKRSAEKGKVAR